MESTVMGATRPTSTFCASVTLLDPGSAASSSSEEDIFPAILHPHRLDRLVFAADGRMDTEGFNRRQTYAAWVCGGGNSAVSGINGNGVLLSQTRLLTARKLLVSYFEASKMLVEAHSGDMGRTIVSAPCQPDLCLVTNQTLDFSIVAVPHGFSAKSGLEPVKYGDKHDFDEGQPVYLMSSDGDSDFGRTSVVPLVVDEWDEGEVCMHAVDGGASCELGSPVYNATGELIAMVVKQSRTGGVRATRLSAILERLRKRSQLVHALNTGGASSKSGEALVVTRSQNLFKVVASRLGVTGLRSPVVAGACVALSAAVVMLLFARR